MPFFFSQPKRHVKRWNVANDRRVWRIWSRGCPAASPARTTVDRGIYTVRFAAPTTPRIRPGATWWTTRANAATSLTPCTAENAGRRWGKSFSLRNKFCMVFVDCFRWSWGRLDRCLLNLDCNLGNLKL